MSNKVATHICSVCIKVAYEGLFFIGGIGPLAVRVGTIEPKHIVFLKLQVLGFEWYFKGFLPRALGFQP